MPGATTTRRLRRRAWPRVLVDIRAALHLVALLASWLSLTLVVPALVAVGYREPVMPFLGPLVIAGSISALTARLTRTPREIGLREGFLVVALVWLVASVIGALPYIFEGQEVQRPVDALFESMSGFTTSGSSVMTDIESHHRSILFWRSMTQWFGGMGIIVLALAILPRLSVGGRQLMQSESPGPELEKLAPRIRDTARRLWSLYVGFTAAEFILLAGVGVTGLEPRMDLYNAACHALTTMPTGGFSPQGRSIEAFGAWAQWIIIVFMTIAGASFVLWFRALRRNPRYVLRDEEFRLYLAILAAATVALALLLTSEDIGGWHETVRHATFQVVSVVTTTGYASADFAVWPSAALALMLGLMFVGGCAASTGGGPKVIRHLVAARAVAREIANASHPERVNPIRISGRAWEERAVRAALAFLMLYVLIFACGVMALLIDAHARGADLTAFDALAAAATTIGNVGPAFGWAGPMGSFAPFSDVSTLVMVALMWTGRLELLPVLVLATRSYWRR